MTTRTAVVSNAVPEWRRPVVAMPLTQAFPELGEVKEFRSKVCLFNHDRSRVFDVVSSRYQVVPHGQAFDLISDTLEEYFGKPVQSDVRSVGGGARIVAKFKLPIAPVKVGRKDVNEIQLLMRNSYDRGWVFSAVLGAFRLVCSNGAMIGESFGSIRSRHVLSSEGEDASIIDQLDYMIQKAPRLQELWQLWADTKMPYDAAHELLVDQFPDRYLAPVLEESRFPRSKWDLYNDLTRFSTHDTKSVARRMEFDEKISKLFYGGEGMSDIEEVSA